MGQTQSILLISVTTELKTLDIESLNSNFHHCNKAITNIKYWKKHVVYCIQKETLLCRTCNKCVKTEAYYIKHLRCHNDPPGKSTSDRGGTSFASNSALTKHISLSDHQSGSPGSSKDWNLSICVTFTCLWAVKPDTLSSKLLMLYV